MAHDATKVLLGTTGSSAKLVTAHDSDPASFVAGTAVSLASTGALSVAASAGQRVGISLGKSLSDHKKTAVARSGESVPVLLTGDGSYVAIGEKVYLDDVTGLANDGEEEGVTISDAMYVSGVLTGINEAGANVSVALVDMPGGL